jgi:hypothetical protein
MSPGRNKLIRGADRGFCYDVNKVMALIEKISRFSSLPTATILP